jgi:hypothetical protein
MLAQWQPLEKALKHAIPSTALVPRYLPTL